MWTIYSIGDSAYLEKILIALAMIVGTGDFHAVVRIGLLVGLLLVLFQALVQGAQRIDFQQVLVAWIIFSGLYGATTTVNIEDAYTGQARPVANVPFGVAAIGSLVSEIGYGLTESFEQAFSVPSITRNGFADAMEVIKRVRITSIDRIGLGYSNDPSRAGRYEFEQSWINYIQNCTIQGIKIGAPLSTGNGIMTDSYIVTATNLLDALKYTNPNAGTRTNINGPQNPDCATAYDDLRRYTLDNFYRDFLKETLANALGEIKDPARVEARIGQALSDLGFGYLSTRDYVVTSVLEPMYAKAWAAEHGVDLAMSYAITIEDALRQRAMQWNAEGSMWQRSIRPMITFLEGFVYAVTPFMALVIVMGPFGVRLAGKYLVLLFWIQLWLPTLAITNLYIMLAIQGKLAALAGTGAGLSLTSISGIMNADSYIQEYLATGQMLAASTPVIALMLVTGAAVTATQFAGRIQGGDFVDEKKVAPDTVNSVPKIQNQSTQQVDTQGGLRQQGADAVLPTFGYSAGAMENVAREDARMRQANQTFTEGFQRTTSNSSSSGERFTSGEYFSSGRSSEKSRADRAALDIGRSVTDSYRSQLGENFERVASAAAEAALGAKSGKGGILGIQGAFAESLQSTHKVGQSTAMALESSLRTAMSNGSVHDAKLTEAIAADYRESKDNYFTAERGLKYDNTLSSAAAEVDSRSQSYREAVSESRNARMDQQLTTPAVAQRFAQDPALRRELRSATQQLGLGGAVDKYLDGKQGMWLTNQLGGDREKAYDVASLMALNGRAGGPQMAPERAQLARDTANGLIYRGFGANFGGFSSPAEYKDVGGNAPQFGSIAPRVEGGVAPARMIAAPLEAPSGVAGPGGYQGMVDEAYARQSGQVTGEAIKFERKVAGEELDVAKKGLLATQAEIRNRTGESSSRFYHSLSETFGRVGDVFSSAEGAFLGGKGTAGDGGNGQANASLENVHRDRIAGYRALAESHGLKDAQATYYAYERYASDLGTRMSEAALGSAMSSTEQMRFREGLVPNVIKESGGGQHGIAALEIISHAARTGSDAALTQIGKYNKAEDHVQTLKESATNPPRSRADTKSDREGGGEMSPEGGGGPVSVPVMAGQEALRGGAGADQLADRQAAPGTGAQLAPSLVAPTVGAVTAGPAEGPQAPVVAGQEALRGGAGGDQLADRQVAPGTGAQLAPSLVAPTVGAVTAGPAERPQFEGGGRASAPVVAGQEALRGGAGGDQLADRQVAPGTGAQLAPSLVAPTVGAVNAGPAERPQFEGGGPASASVVVGRQAPQASVGERENSR